jgi:hypothetical protein
VLRPGGRIAIAYPDRRFTFDIKRKPSTEADLMAAYFEKRTRPNVTQICDHFWHASRVHPVDAWKEGFNPSDAPFIHDRKTIVNILKSKAEIDAYTDCHCWIFTDEEFSKVILSVAEIFGFPIRMINLKNTRLNSTEFYVTLEKTS